MCIESFAAVFLKIVLELFAPQVGADCGVLKLQGNVPIVDEAVVAVYVTRHF